MLSKNASPELSISSPLDIAEEIARTYDSNVDVICNIYIVNRAQEFVPGIRVVDDVLCCSKCRRALSSKADLSLLLNESF